MPRLKSLRFGGDAFDDCSRAVFENLPELTSIQLAYRAFYFKDDDSSELIMRNLPKLTSLTTVQCSCSFWYPRIITLEDMPSLTTVSLIEGCAFSEKKTVHTKNITPALECFLNAPKCAFIPPPPF
ncbi:hypothetical protein WA556_005463 [Blastocystis sp. ATCC 50177/Nand II]